MAGAIRLVVGLGNPGAEYTGTRHNAGAWFVESLAARLGCSLNEEKRFAGLTGKAFFCGSDLRLLIPQTYMNRSGQSVQPLCAFFRIEPEEILVAHDELDLAPGVARFKSGGGHGGHNGLRDIIQRFGGNRDFHRLRLGIGHPGKGRDVTGFVLGRAPRAENELLEDAIDRAIDCLEDAVQGNWEKARTSLHSSDPT